MEFMKPIVDQIYRIIYFIAYRIIKLFWVIRKPKTNGVLIAVWYQGKILLVRNSYHDYYTLPGGYLKRKESPINAAIRELQEEIGIIAEPGELEPVLDTQHNWENREDHVTIFTLRVNEKPRIQIDNREVISAGFYSPTEILNMNVFPPIRSCIEQSIK